MERGRTPELPEDPASTWENERLAAFHPPLQLEARSRRAKRVPDEEWNHIRTAAHDALREATLEGARYLGMDAHIGSLEEGKLADLIVLEANPLEDLRNSERIRWTMVNGPLFDARTLDESGNHPGGRSPFYWEDWGWR